MTKTKTKERTPTAEVIVNEPTTVGKEVAIVQPKTALVRQQGITPAGAVHAMVKLAQDKNFDAVKFQALADFQDRMGLRQQEISFNEDFHQLQAVLPEITADKKIEIKAKGTERVIQTTPYSSFPQLMRILKPLLSEHNFTLNFIEHDAPPGRVLVTGVLAHTGGHKITSTKGLPLESSGSKNDVQGYGSATSYAKRYITIGLLNITSAAPEDRDDDGQTAGDPKKALINDDQFELLEKKLLATGTDRVAFRDHYGLESIREMTVKQFEKAVGLLDQKAAKLAETKPAGKAGGK